MSKRYIKITRLVESTSIGMETIAKYTCLCGQGYFEYHAVPGFDDDWFEIKCEECKKRISFIGWSSPNEWAIVEKDNK